METCPTVINPARRRGAKKKTKATLPRCFQGCDGCHFNRTLLASSKGEPLMWTNAIKVKAPRFGGL